MCKKHSHKNPDTNLIGVIGECVFFIVSKSVVVLRFSSYQPKGVTKMTKTTSHRIEPTVRTADGSEPWQKKTNQTKPHPKKRFPKKQFPNKNTKRVSPKTGATLQVWRCRLAPPMSLPADWQGRRQDLGLTQGFVAPGGFWVKIRPLGDRRF